MEVLGHKKKDYEKQSYETFLSFKSKKEIKCTRFYHLIETLLKRRPKILFQRVKTDRSTFLRGILALRSFECPLLERLDLYEIWLQFAYSTRDEFESAERKLPRRVLFSGIDGNIHYPELLDYLNGFGKVSTTSKSQSSKHSGPIVKPNQGYVEYVSAVAVEHLLAKGTVHLVGSIYVSFAIDLSCNEPDSLSKIEKEKSSQHLANRNSKLALSNTRTIKTSPNLDFSGHQHKSTSNAFGGFFIRPYLRNAEVISENSQQVSNIRLNVLKPKPFTSTKF